MSCQTRIFPLKINCVTRKIPGWNPPDFLYMVIKPLIWSTWVYIKWTLKNYPTEEKFVKMFKIYTQKYKKYWDGRIIFHPMHIELSCLLVVTPTNHPAPISAQLSVQDSSVCGYMPRSGNCWVESQANFNVHSFVELSGI